MKNFISKVLGAAGQYTVWDFGLLKLCLFSFGILFGVYFTSFFSAYLPVVWVIFAASYIFIMYRTFIKHYGR